MARIKASEKKNEEGAITPKPISQAATTPTKASEPKPIPKPKVATEQPKRRTLQDRRPALKKVQEPLEHKIVTKPIYTEDAGVTTKTISETKEVVPKPKPIIRPVRSKSGAIFDKETRTKQIEEARSQQERAIEDAQAAYATRQREEADTARGFEQKKREQEEVSYRLGLDSQGRYHRES